MKNTTTKIDLNWTKLGISIPAGTELTVTFAPEMPNRICITHVPSGRVLKTSSKNAHKQFTGFIRTPSEATLAKWSDEGFCKTLTGERTEPDGTGTDGAPSWLLALGVI